MTTKPKLFVFGIDGGSYALMKNWMDAGFLPTFAAFARESLTASLRCTWPPHTATGWSSIFSGRLPGQHGIFNFWDSQSSDYRLHVTSSRALGTPMLWDVLASKGWTLGLLNIPMSHPPHSWPGYEVTWPLVPTLHYSRPQGILRQIANAGGLAIPDIACMYDGSPDYPSRAISYIRARTEAVKYLLTHQPTDAVAVVYTEPDRVSHHFWPALDITHPLHIHTPMHERGVIAAIYAEVDAAFAEILQYLDDDCLIMVVSDHGFGPGTTGLRIHPLLAEKGFCRLRKDQLTQTSQDEFAEFSSAANRVNLFDWAETLAYMPAPGCFGLNVNLIGRQRDGCVHPGDQNAVMQDLTAYLLTIKHPNTGQRVFDAIIPSSVAYLGPYSNLAPDLLLVPSDPALMVLHNPNGLLWDLPGQMGLHRMEGVWMLRGRGVRPHNQETMMPIEAVAGQILEALSISSSLIPSGIESVARYGTDLPADAWSVQRDAAPQWETPHVASWAAAKDKTRTSLPPPYHEDDPRIIERLRNMGYLE